MRANLLVAIAQLDKPVVVITSASAGEGKTSTCVSLAQSFVATGVRVAIVDLDLRDGNSHRLLRTHNDRGVSDVLLGRAALRDCLQYVALSGSDATRDVGMYFLAAGPTVTNPTELLSTTRMVDLLEALAAEVDIVLVDAPPVLPVADTLIIGRLAAGAVLVVEAGGTPVAAARGAKDALTRNQTRLLGVILNKFKANAAAGVYGSGGERELLDDVARTEAPRGNGARRKV